MKKFVLLMISAGVFVICGYVCLICHEAATGILFMTTGIILTIMAAIALICSKIEQGSKKQDEPDVG